MNKNKLNNEDSLMASIIFKFLPFWPLFLLLIALCTLGGWVYLRYFSTPTYAISASLLIKDEEKGVNTSKIAESIDPFNANKTVENELNVLRSYSLMSQVVQKLRLYAPVFEEDEYRTLSAYESTPVIITLKDPEKVKEQEAVYFTFDDQRKLVLIGQQEYPMEKWIKTPYGELQFTKNPYYKRASENPMFFSIKDPQKVAQRLSNSIVIETPGKLSSIVSLYVEDQTPQRGEDILNTLINAYQKAAFDEKNQLVSQTLGFVEDRIKLLEKELQELEEKIVQYRSTKDAVNLNEQGRMFLQSVGENDRRISEINLQLAVLDNVESYVKAKDKAAGIVPSTLGVNDPVLSQLLQKLYDAEIQYQQLRKTTAENNPLLLPLKEEIESIRPGILENISNQRDNLIASKSKIETNNSAYSSMLQSIPQKERELLEISRQQSIKNDTYSFLLQKREETVLLFAPSAEDIRIIDMAIASSDPISPKPLYIYFSSIILAIGAGFALITSKEMLHNKLMFRSEIEEHIDAPIVAELATTKSKKKNVLDEPSEVAQIEQFRQLRVTMGLYGRTFTRRKILITSSIPGEGKSYVSSNLAISLASSGKKVALLDFDLRNPNTSVLFENTDNDGIIEYLNGDLAPSDIIRASSFECLSIVPAGIAVGDHTELLLQSSKMEALFNYLGEMFDYVLVDTPPIDLVSDAFLLSEYCDITLLIIRHAYTPKSLVQRLSVNNKLSSLNNVAVVFNGVKPRGFVKGQYGYGYGYGYENKYNNKTYKARRLAKS